MAIDGTTPGNALQRLRDLLSALPKADRGIHYESAHRRAGRGYETEMLTVYGEMARALFWITNNTQTIETAFAAAEQPVVELNWNDRTAPTPFGDYVINSPGGDWFMLSFAGSVVLTVVQAPLEHVKEHAQHDFEARIRGALASPAAIASEVEP